MTPWTLRPVRAHTDYGHRNDGCYNPIGMASWRVLVVDDEQSICDVLSISLKKEGYLVSAETNPRRALERLSCRDT